MPVFQSPALRTLHVLRMGVGRKGGCPESMMQANPPDTNGLNGIDSRYASKHIAGVVDTHATRLELRGRFLSKLAEHASRNTTLQASHRAARQPYRMRHTKGQKSPCATFPTIQQHGLAARARRHACSGMFRARHRTRSAPIFLSETTATRPATSVGCREATVEQADPLQQGCKCIAIRA